MSVLLRDHHLSIVQSPLLSANHVRSHPREFLTHIPSFSDTPTNSPAFAHQQRDDPYASYNGPLPGCLPPPPCEGPDCATTHTPPCLPHTSSHHPPTGIPTFTPLPPTSSGHPPGSSETTATTSPPQSSSPTVSVTITVSSTGTSVPAIGPPPPPGTAYLLTAVQIAGIALGGALAVLLLGVFLWLFRRGTFGSGALFGLRYGSARHAGFRPDLGTGNVGAEMSQAGKGAASIGNLTSPFGAERGTSLPSYPSSTLTASVPSLPFIPEAKLHHAPSIAFSIPQAPEPPPPPRSPAVWSTSPSAFDNAYGSIVAGCPSTTCPSTSGSGSRRTPSVSMSDASTLVSERLASISITTPIPSYIASPTPTRDVVSYASSGTRTPSPAPTESVASTIEGVRISSWHSSDSEETELIVRALPRR